MDQLTPLLETGATLGLVTTLAFQAWKPFAEYWLVKPTHPLHDAVLRLMCFITAVVLALLSALGSLVPGAHLDGPGLWSILKTAGGAWLVALLTYHALNGDLLGGLTGTQRTTTAPLTWSGTITGGSLTPPPAPALSPPPPTPPPGG